MQTSLHTLRVPFHLSLVRQLEQLLRDGAQQLKRRHAAARERRRVRDTLMSLRSLDDHTLRDLGIHRSEIASIAAHAFDPDGARAMRSVFGPSI